MVSGEQLITGRAPLEAAQSIFQRLANPATDEVKHLFGARAWPIGSGKFV
jgi:hypothetical protein